MDQELTAVGVTSANDLRGVPLAKLTKAFGERTAKYMYSACRGEVCNSPWRGQGLGLLSKVGAAIVFRSSARMSNV